MSDTNPTFGSSDEPTDTIDKTASRSELYKERLDMGVFTPLRIIWDDWRTQVGSIIILFYLLMGSVGVLIVPAPNPGQGPRLLGAFQNMAFPLGTNNLGESLLSVIVYATPPMLKMIAAGAVFSTAVATVVGTVSGYKGGTVDRVLTTFNDVAMTIPALPLIIVIAAIVQPRNPIVIGIILSINAWAGLARAIRSQTLALRDYSYVEASRIMGVSVRRILVDDILPRLMPYVLINFVNAARGVIFGSVALYFLGILPSAHANWGIILNNAFNSGAIYSLNVIHWLIVPMITIVTLSFGLVLFAQGTEKLFNPRIRARHAETVDDETTPNQG
jgi:peptide/nickel transport system permease protein